MRRNRTGSAEQSSQHLDLASAEVFFFLSVTVSVQTGSSLAHRLMSICRWVCYRSSCILLAFFLTRRNRDHKLLDHCTM